MVTNIATSLHYINLFIHYLLRMIKDKISSYKRTCLKEDGKPNKGMQKQKWKYFIDQEIISI